MSVSPTRSLASARGTASAPVARTAPSPSQSDWESRTDARRQPTPPPASRAEARAVEHRGPRGRHRRRQALSDARAMLAANPAKRLSAKTQAFRSQLLSQREERSLALAAGLGKRVSWDRILGHMAL